MTLRCVLPAVRRLCHPDQGRDDKGGDNRDTTVATSVLTIMS